jgi:DNA-binding ferritin-like protein
VKGRTFYLLHELFDKLAEAVAEALETDPRIHAAAIEVSVLLGVVELRRVATAEEREEAVRAARRVPGVQAVANQLEVELARSAPVELSRTGDER